MAKWVYNPETLLYEPQNESKGLKFLRICALVIIAPALAALYFWLYTSVFNLELPKTSFLRHKNAAYLAKIELLNRQMDIYEEALTGIEERDDHVYRSIYGLGEIPDEVKSSGFGDGERYTYLDEFGANATLKATVRRMDVLTKRAWLQSKALEEVDQLAKDAGDMIACVPSVPPILPETGKYHLSSPFGYRTDPVYGGGEYHAGQDIATHRGNPVYATGDGVIEVADFNFRGYGNEVLIDHGYGYKSHYAHLNTIEVVPGMTVHRGDRIGTVGNSGKSTGCHLHYEVIYLGSCVNPMNFMDMDMPIEEYKAMIAGRAQESVHGKKNSTSELLNRHRQQ